MSACQGTAIPLMFWIQREETHAFSHGRYLEETLMTLLYIGGGEKGHTVVAFPVIIDTSRTAVTRKPDGKSKTI